MKTVLVISQNRDTSVIIKNNLGDAYKKVLFSDIQSALDFIFNEMPHMVIIDIEHSDAPTFDTLANLKTDPMFNQLPVILVVDENQSLPSWDKLYIEDYIFKTNILRDISRRVSLCIQRLERIVEINPLTRLPGNISINKHIQERLDAAEKFSLAYADLDNFKPFNDSYGFSRGDDVIKMTGRIIFNIVRTHQPDNSFIGHIGGDDFIFIMNPTLIGLAAREILTNFDQIIPVFYNDSDRTSGHIKSVDRSGNSIKFPIMTISIGIADTEHNNYTHYGQISEIASELKKFAKKEKGSCCKFDRRNHRLPFN